MKIDDTEINEVIDNLRKLETLERGLNNLRYNCESFSVLVSFNGSEYRIVAMTDAHRSVYAAVAKYQYDAIAITVNRLLVRGVTVDYPDFETKSWLRSLGILHSTQLDPAIDK